MTNNFSLPDSFMIQMQAQLGLEFEAFLAALDASPPTSIRFNTYKSKNKQENFDGVKWCSNGVYLSDRPVFTLDPAFHAGAYYVQEASSMFVSEAVRQTVDLSKPLKALDLCAAPGGKSTLLASVLPENSLILCNEVIKNRYHILRENLTKWGYPGTHAASHDSRDFTNLEGFFDLVLVDAPCSGEGLFRKDKKAIAEWSPENVQLCAARQKRILADAVKTVRPGGTLLYCTCTYNDSENEQNAAWLAQEFGLECVTLEIPENWGIVHKEFGYQFYPHRVRGEGFYITCFKKTKGSDFQPDKNPAFAKWKSLPKQSVPIIRDWLQHPDDFAFFQNEKGNIFAILQSQLQDCQLIAKYLFKINLGLEIGMIKGKDLVPSHALALSTAIHKNLQRIALNKDQALHYLKKENIQLAEIPASWALVQYNEQNLGWIKGIGNRINNYLPKDWRIMMELPSEN